MRRSSWLLLGLLVGVVVAAPYGESPSRASAMTENVIVLTAQFTDRPPLDLANTRTDLARVRAFYLAQSYGTVDLVFDVRDPYNLPVTQTEGCAQDPALATQDLMRQADPDVNYPTYVRAVFIFDCAFTASGGCCTTYTTDDGPWYTANARIGNIGSPPAYQDARTFAHELGHGMFSPYSLLHANGYSCGRTTGTAFEPLSSGLCSEGEYADEFDVLGSPLFASNELFSEMNAAHKLWAGWLDTTTMPTVTGSGTWTLTPYEQQGAGVHALRIPRGDGTFWTVEWRRPIGEDAWFDGPYCASPFPPNAPCTTTQGALIHLAKGPVPNQIGSGDTLLIDTTPHSNDSGFFYFPVDDFEDAALLPGRSFADPETGIVISSLGMLTVAVTFPGDPPPTTTTVLPTTTTRPCHGKKCR